MQRPMYQVETRRDGVPTTTAEAGRAVLEALNLHAEDDDTPTTIEEVDAAAGLWNIEVPRRYEDDMWDWEGWCEHEPLEDDGGTNEVWISEPTH